MEEHNSAYIDLVCHASPDGRLMVICLFSELCDFVFIYIPDRELHPRTLGL